jgi:hypothetical protein
MTRKQIEECLKNFNWKWELENVYDEDHVFSCWRMKGSGNGSRVCLVLDWDHEGSTKGPLLITADGKKEIVRHFSVEMATQLVTIFGQLLENRKRAQAQYAKKIKKTE